jgi:hypothetical protein
MPYVNKIVFAKFWTIWMIIIVRLCHKGVGYDGLVGIRLAQDSERWRTLVKTVTGRKFLD